MEIKGNVGDLKEMIEKMSAKALFEPISIKLIPEKDVIISRLVFEGMQCGAFLRFHGFEIDADGEELITFKGDEFLKQISPLSNNSDFTATVDDGSLVVDNSKDTVYYHLEHNEDEDPDNYMDKMPLLVEEGRIFLKGESGKKRFDTKLSMDSSEFGNVISRMNTNGADFITFKEKDGDFEAQIGKLTSSKIHPRKYNMNVEIQENEGGNEEVTVAVGVEEISKVLSGHIEMHYSESSPIVLYDQVDPDEDDSKGYSALYIISPATG